METNNNFNEKATANVEDLQPEKYSAKELQGLKMFIDKVRDVKARTSLACWGDHSEYGRGY